MHTPSTAKLSMGWVCFFEVPRLHWPIATLHGQDLVAIQASLDYSHTLYLSRPPYPIIQIPPCTKANMPNSSLQLPQLRNDQRAIIRTPFFSRPGTSTLPTRCFPILVTKSIHFQHRSHGYRLISLSLSLPHLFHQEPRNTHYMLL